MKTYKEQKVEHKNFVRDIQEPPMAKVSKKKNTKVWCKGVSGREHIYEVYETRYDWKFVPAPNHPGFSRMVDDETKTRNLMRCLNCGKENEEMVEI